MKNGNYILTIAPKDFPGKKYRGKYCYEHTLVYWQTYGILPKSNEIIHHIDENKCNNNPENLELISRSYHSKKHTHNRKTTYVMLKCPGCEKIFIREKRNTYLIKGGNATCCSRECIGKYTALNKLIKQKRIDTMFIKEFKK